MRAVILDWSFEPWVVISLGVGLGWYLAGLWRIHRRLGIARVASKAEVAAFMGGMATLVIALLSPIDSIGEQLFSVHMLQHLLLIMVVAPLIAISRSALVFLWAWPRAGRRVMGRIWAGLGLRRGVHGLMHPLIVWLLFSGIFVFWHFPRPYAWAFDNEAVHAAEHISFFVTALMFWTIVFEPDGHRRLGYGPTLIFVTTTAVLSSLPGALMVLASEPLYRVHAAGVATWHMTLVEDQQIAGVIMWIPAGSVYLAATCFVFVRWIAESDRPVVLPRGRSVLLSLFLLGIPFLSGCKDHGSQAIASSLGNPKRGVALIKKFGCGSCHTIPGVENADGVVGPPLIQVGRRIYIAGVLRNTPDNMVRWLRNPQAVVPGNAMPDMLITQPDAKDIAAYLYTLR